MSWRSKAKKFAWQFFKIDDPVTLRDDYIDKTIDRERKPRQLSKWDRVNFLNAFNWYPSHYSAYEKRFLLKVDICVFLFLGASFFTKFLDNVNVGTAYVSGLKEDLDLHGNELNIFNTCYSVGYAVFQVPLTLLLTKHQFSRHLLLFCELAYGMMTLANAYVKTARQMYAVRFFVGVFEASLLNTCCFCHNVEFLYRGRALSESRTLWGIWNLRICKFRGIAVQSKGEIGWCCRFERLAMAIYY